MSRRARSALLVLSAFCVLASILPRPARAEPRVEVVTIDPGDAMWTRWGHIALRVIDPARDLDILFNYGYAPFDQPGFLWGYLRGESEFRLAVKRWDWSLDRYRRWDRTVTTRPLELPPPALHELLVRLQENARPENAGYRYDHLRDNCSTRIRDLLDTVTGGALRAAAEARPAARTYRDDTLRAGSGRTALQIAFDLIGGPNQEREVAGWDTLYLPADLAEALADTAVPWPGGEVRPVLGPPHVVYARHGPPPLSDDLGAGRRAVAGAGVLAGLLVLAAGLWGRGSAPRRLLTRAAGLALLAAGLLFGLVGMALLALVVVSRISDFAWNENVLVFWLTDLALVAPGVRWLVRGRPELGRVLRRYLTLRLLVLAAYGAAKAIGVFPQDNWAFLACAVMVVGGPWLGGRLSPRAGAQAAPAAG